MNIYTKWVFSLVSVWFVLLSPVLPGIAQTPTEGERTQNKNASSSGQVVDSPTSQETSSSPKAVIKLKPVTITATRIEKPLTAIPNTVTIVEREAITQQTTIRTTSKVFSKIRFRDSVPA